MVLQLFVSLLESCPHMSELNRSLKCQKELHHNWFSESGHLSNFNPENEGDRCIKETEPH